MWMISLLFLAPGPAQASEFFDSIGQEMEMPLASGWPRVFSKADDSGWWFLAAQGGNYNLMEMTNDYELDTRHTPLTPPTGDQNGDGILDSVLKDHSITQCPDGTYLHVASANLECPGCNDSAYAFRYSADFDLVNWSPLEERVDSRAHNDLPVSCGYGMDLTVFGGPANYGIDVLSTFFWINEDATPGDSLDLLNTPNTAGNTFFLDEDTHDLHIIELNSTWEMRISTLNSDLEIVNVEYENVLEEGHKGGWPQAVLRVEDTYMVAFVNQGGPGEWQGLVGDINIAFFDLEWVLKESVNVTELEPSGGGAMTPGLARRGDTILLTYDKNVVPHLIVLDLNMDAFGAEDTDTGTPGEDTGRTWELDDTGGDSYTPKSCSCSAGPTSASSWLALGMLGFIRRRRRDSGSD
jgi:MYXO-CTERM domain-containing protein